MAEDPPPVRIVLWNDAGEALAAGVEDEQQAEVLRSFAGLVDSVIDATLALPQFRHVQAVVVDAAEEEGTSLAIAFDFGSADAEVDLDKVQGQLDIAGLLLGSASLPEELASVAEVAVTDEELGATELHFSDEALAKDVATILKRARLERRYNEWYGSVEADLGPALDAASAEVEVAETPMDPFDVVQALVAHIIKVAGISPPAPSLLSRSVGAIRGLLGAPRGAVRQLGKRLKRAQRLWWRLEDVIVDGSKLALRVGLKAARPVLVGLVLHRVLRTIDRSRGLEMRMSRLSPAAAKELYYKEVLGSDWKEQLQADMDKAVQDVNEGLVTDEINQEKRLMTAAQIRRLEVEEWDKQRMKNFYLSSFGGLRWFDQMEAALHNPMFIESRGWTDPVENWVGRNRTYEGDLPQGVYMSDIGATAIALKEAELKRRLTPEERARILQAGAAVTGGLLHRAPKDLAHAAIEAGGAIVPRSSKK
ncbi:hypothetical protein HYH03_005477 [Edaphochlamys debaryana]|uniref:Uncharacterized protein n=1 Tax=Edaphochlamys debaryana TaxID=47281 RepID=A0A835Y7W4_9CHLO|nr:hypothetical protein HYH03_005477 [Edaphochlamys debaryana]|eukprot:KAG2496657.1 hypothetical protein HYH03_005477 [Edaphochlamys debaryana]